MNSRRFVMAAVAVAGVAVALTGGAATNAAPCTLEPQLVGVTINQGLGSYANLVRGKQTVVRGYWSLPSCMGTVDSSGQLTNGGYIQMNSETLAWTNNTAKTTLQANIASNPSPLGAAGPPSTYPLITNVVAAPGKINAPADAEFLVPPSALSLGPASGYTAGIQITATFQVKTSSTAALGTPVTKTYTTLAGSTAAITKAVAPKTNALPVLIVPMGFAPDATTNAAISSAVAAASRTFPVPDGTGRLDGTAGGIRYAVSNGILDLTGLLESDGTFCGSSSNFAAIKTKLAAFAQAWNQSPTATALAGAVPDATSTAITLLSTTGFPTTYPFRVYVDNELMKVTGAATAPATYTVTRGIEGTTAAAHAAAAPVTLSTNQAQRVIGVVNAANSDVGTITRAGGSTATCYRGYASLSTPQGWFRADDRAGAVFVQELAHTFNVVPNFIGTTRNGRSDGSNHSVNPNADAALADANRGYRTTDGVYLSDDHSAMLFADGVLPAPPSAPLVTGLWNDSDVVFEPADYASLLCKLGGPTTTDCTSNSQPVGTSVGVASAPAVSAFSVIGTTDGKCPSRKPDGTCVGTDVAFSSQVTTVTTAADPTSQYRLVQKGGASEANTGVPVSFTDTVHAGPDAVGAAADSLTSDTGSFSVAFPAVAGTTTVELWKVPIVNGAPAAPGSADSVKLWSSVKSAPPQIGTAPVLQGPTIAGGKAGAGANVSTAPERPVSAPPRTPGPPLGPPPNGRHLLQAAPRTLAATGVDPVTSDDAGAAALVDAIAATPSAVTGASFASVPPSGAPNGIAGTSFNALPTNGSSFGILTSGDVNIANTANCCPNSTQDDGGGNVRGDTDFDVTVLRVGLSVPDGANCVGVDFRFLSEEYPEFVNTQYNDGFIAELDDSTWTTSGSTITAPNNFAFDPSGKVVSINSSGNTAMSPAGAEGTTYDGGTPLLTAATSVTPGAHTLYLSIFDQGDHFFDSAVFLDNLVVGTTTATGCTPGAKPKSTTEQVVQVPVSDSDSTNVTVTLRLACPQDPDAPPVILGVLVPVVNGVATATVTQGEHGCVITASASDGFSSTPFTAVAPSDLDNLDRGSSAAITTPTPNQKLLQFDAITFSGIGYTRTVSGGTLPDSALSWSSTLPGFGSHTGTGSFTVSPPPASGWQPGEYSVTLTTSDGASDTRSFRILADGDHDGIPASNDGGCLTGGDANPINAGSDTDADGLIAVDDMYTGTPEPFANDAICTPATAYVGRMLFVPGAIDTSSTSSTFSISGIVVPNRDLKQVPQASVKMSSIAGLAADIPATKWVVSAANGAVFGVATFDLQKIIAFLNAHNIHNRGVLLTVSGQATAGQLKATTSWRFDASVSDLVK